MTLRLAGNHHAGDIWEEEFINLRVGMLQALKYSLKYILCGPCCIRVGYVSLTHAAVNLELNKLCNCLPFSILQKWFQGRHLFLRKISLASHKLGTIYS